MILSRKIFIKAHADLHEYAENKLKNSKKIDFDDPETWLWGDIYDMANVKKSLARECQNSIDRARFYLKHRYLFGNHERQADSDQFVRISDRVGAMHGDFIFLGNKRSIEYRAGEHGAGFLKRKLWVNLLEAAEHGYDRETSTEDLYRAEQICLKYGVDTLIVAHKHPKKMQTTHFVGYKKEITLIVLPRGYTLLEIQGANVTDIT